MVRRAGSQRTRHQFVSSSSARHSSKRAAFGLRNCPPCSRPMWHASNEASIRSSCSRVGRSQLASYDGPTITALFFDSASIPRLMQDLNDLLFGMPLARSPSFANDLTWTCGFRAPARGFGDVCGDAFRLGRSLSDKRRCLKDQCDVAVVAEGSQCQAAEVSD